ncbi:hypothetical protein [Trinickia mobilis]|uniref:hypothetical protein n=1 Tax=Trinickia mobilis TaxID=2816356 RepID=UPI001A8D5B97|nr:hypothetical protein [Trinickia mobilis]
MRAVTFTLLLAAAAMPALSIGAGAPLTGVFYGEGRACFGGLFVRSKTIEWNSSFSKCGPVRYEILDQDLAGEQPRIAYRLLERSKQCRSAVIALSHYDGNVWDVKGYPSVEAYEKREVPDWKHSALPDRTVTSCGMLKQ